MIMCYKNPYFTLHYIHVGCGQDTAAQQSETLHMTSEIYLAFHQDSPSAGTLHTIHTL